MRQSSTIFRAVAATAMAAGLAMTPPAFAQEAEEERTPGDAYVAGVYTDWELRCITAANPELPEQCEMFQILLDEQDTAVAVFRVSVPLTAPEEQVAAAIIVTPLETLLAPGIRLRIDDGEVVGVPYTLCDSAGCLSRIPMTEETVEAFKAGGDAFIEIFALVRNDLGEIGGVPVGLRASLRGFTAAYDALREAHAPFAEFVTQLQAEAAAAAAEEQGATE